MGTQRLRGLQFEDPILEIEDRITSLISSGMEDDSTEIMRLKSRLEELERTVYKSLSPWERVQLARHNKRPRTKDIIGMVCDEFLELHGDRYYGDDPAIIAGIARMGKQRLVVLGHEKGKDIQSKVKRNFGMANPEGFRKALRVMKLAEKFGLPVLSFIDTPGAYPGIGAEERGQFRAIAKNIEEFFELKTPVVVVILGEGGSGGALGIAVGDRVIMMEHAIYSVISPEGCAAILWKSNEKAPEAAEALRLTSMDCWELGIVDRVLEEVHGAIHRDPRGNAELIKDAVLSEFESLLSKSSQELLAERENKFYSMGVYSDH
jgi:acetyl-CoA carboxylase carboxyl transferase subunit alpha